MPLQNHVAQSDEWAPGNPVAASASDEVSAVVEIARVLAPHEPRPQADFQLRPADLEHCARLLREGSRSFHAASLLLPERVLRPSTVLYAFCRVADDLIDEQPEPQEGVEALRRRLDAIYAGEPDDDPVDRALSAVVLAWRIPRAVPDALVEGFSWDAQRRRYDTLAELLGYCARVASTVGVMMTLVMRERRPEVIARACDLGLAMQLTNIARDVGEDARAGRLYLPAQWLLEEGMDPDAFLCDPRFEPALGRVVRRLLDAADALYEKSEAGIRMLPRDCRIGIQAARLVYADIGRSIRRNGFDSVAHRAVVPTWRKVFLVLRSLTYALSRTAPAAEVSSVLARPASGVRAWAPEAHFLLEALEDTFPSPERLSP
ncbi:MAG: phytoene/squalene synthase family protein [Deltaproteobacteria bacterium]|nr:phytoene/squalene synthase family protein [Deltaproteobacteria bacterium]